MTDLTQLQGWLIEAQSARHALLTGSLRQRVNYQGDEVWFAATDIDKLNTYIATLESQIAGLSGDPRNVRRPIYFTF
jgi:hypothetical protein